MEETDIKAPSLSLKPASPPAAFSLLYACLLQGPVPPARGHGHLYTLCAGISASALLQSVCACC